MCTGTTWYQMAPTIRYELDGVKPEWSAVRTSSCTSPTPTATRLISTSNTAVAGLHALPMHDRRTIATQGAEVSADFSTFAADEVLRDHLNSIGVADYVVAQPDPDAHYRTHDASTSARWNLTWRDLARSAATGCRCRS